MEFYNQVMTAAEYLRGQTDLRPTVGVILGSGLGSLADRIQDAEAVLYRDIPGFPRSQVQGHAAAPCVAARVQDQPDAGGVGGLQSLITVGVEGAGIVMGVGVKNHLPHLSPVS